MSVIDRVAAEMQSASDRYGDFTSTHEGYGVLAEEVDELLEAIRSNDRSRIEDEAVQVSAVAARIAQSLSNSATKSRSNVE